MDKQTEALKLALEALEETLRTLDDENAKPGGAISDTIWYSEHETLFDYIAAQITAIREALAEQPEQQEPFGHVTVRRLSQRFENHHDQYHFYPAGQSPYLDNVDECHAVYTSPPASKPFVGLTDKEYQELHLQMGAVYFYQDYGRAIEAKLREKNA